MKMLKKAIAILILSTACLTQGNTQDIIIIKEQGAVMEGYFEKVTKTEVVVRFGIYSTTINRKLVKIIVGEYYDSLKEEELLHPFDSIEVNDKVIKKAIRKSKKELKKRLKAVKS